MKKINLSGFGNQVDEVRISESSRHDAHAPVGHELQQLEGELKLLKERYVATQKQVVVLHKKDASRRRLVLELHEIMTQIQAITPKVKSGRRILNDREEHNLVSILKVFAMEIRELKQLVKLIAEKQQ